MYNSFWIFQNDQKKSVQAWTLVEIQMQMHFYGFHLNAPRTIFWQATVNVD